MNQWNCPNARDFIAQIVTIISEGKKHVCILSPAIRTESFKESLLSQCDGYIVQPESQYQHPLVCLKTCFGIEEPATLMDLAEMTLPAGMGIFMSLPENLGQEYYELWRIFFKELAQISKQRLDRDDELFWKIICLWPPSVKLPQKDICLDVLSISSLFEESDLEYAVEQCLKEINGQERTSLEDRIWLHALCVGLAKNDPDLCQEIFFCQPRTAIDIYTLLSAHPYANLKKNLEVAVIAWGKNHNSRSLPRETANALKEEGILSIDIYGNEFLHPAALLAAKQERSIVRQIVMGQMRVYLPMMHQVHKIILGKLEEECGSNWHSMNGNSYDRMYAEIGPLHDFMIKFLKGKCSFEILEIAKIWRDTRNTLAHGKILNYEIAKNAVMRFSMMLNK